MNKSLSEMVKWLNMLFAQKHCVKCKSLTKIDKDKGLCVDCFRMECFKVKTEKRCAVCLEDITHNIHLTACNHLFHFVCVVGLEKCPLCRYNFLDSIEWHTNEFNAESSDDDTY